MKLLFVWLINTIIVLPFKIIRLVIKIIYQVIKNIYFNNLNLDYINNLDGYQFEAFTKTLLEKNGFKDVRISKSSNDYGIDILAKKDDYTYAIQCKRYNKPVGIKAIQEAIAGCVYYQCDIPVVFTNSTFSKAAINLANINDTLGRTCAYVVDRPFIVDELAVCTSFHQIRLTFFLVLRLVEEVRSQPRFLAEVVV